MERQKFTKQTMTVVINKQKPFNGLKRLNLQLDILTHFKATHEVKKMKMGELKKELSKYPDTYNICGCVCAEELLTFSPAGEKVAEISLVKGGDKDARLKATHRSNV